MIPLVIVLLTAAVVIGALLARRARSRRQLILALEEAEAACAQAGALEEDGQLDGAWRALDEALGWDVAALLADPQERLIWLQYPVELERLCALTAAICARTSQLARETAFVFQLRQLDRLHALLRGMCERAPLSFSQPDHDPAELARLCATLSAVIDGRGRARLEVRPLGQREEVRARLKRALLGGDLAATRALLPELMPWPFAVSGDAFWEDLEALARISELLSMSEVADAAHDLLELYPDLNSTRALGDALIAEDMPSSAARLLHGCWIHQNLDADSTIAYSDALLAMSQPAEARAVLMSAGLLHTDVFTDPRLSRRLNIIEAQLRRLN
jgi:hypothetical protein